MAGTTFNREMAAGQRIDGFRANNNCPVPAIDRDGLYTQSITFGTPPDRSWTGTGWRNPLTAGNAEKAWLRCGRFDSVGDNFYCARNTGGNRIIFDNDPDDPTNIPGFGMVHQMANMCNWDDYTNNPDANNSPFVTGVDAMDPAYMTCDARCEIPGDPDIAYSGSKTLIEYTILSGRFADCYPPTQSGGFVEAADGSQGAAVDWTDRATCYDNSVADGHCDRRAYDQNGDEKCVQRKLGSFYFTFADVDQYGKGENPTNWMDGKEQIIALDPYAVFVRKDSKDAGLDHYWTDNNGNRCWDDPSDTSSTTCDCSINGHANAPCNGDSTPQGYAFRSYRGDPAEYGKSSGDPGYENHQQRTCTGYNNSPYSVITGCGANTDNPKDPNGMEDWQEKHSFTVLHRQKSQFYAEMTVTGGGAGRNNLFAFGSSMAPQCKLGEGCDALEYINKENNDRRRLQEMFHLHPLHTSYLGEAHRARRLREQTPWFPELKPPQQALTLAAPEDHRRQLYHNDPVHHLCMGFALIDTTGDGEPDKCVFYDEGHTPDGETPPTPIPGTTSIWKLMAPRA